MPPHARYRDRDPVAAALYLVAWVSLVVAFVRADDSGAVGAAALAVAAVAGAWAWSRREPTVTPTRSRIQLRTLDGGHEFAPERLVGSGPLPLPLLALAIWPLLCTGIVVAAVAVAGKSVSTGILVGVAVLIVPGLLTMNSVLAAPATPRARGRLTMAAVAMTLFANLALSSALLPY
jgi:hypothetical protein